MQYNENKIYVTTDAFSVTGVTLLSKIDDEADGVFAGHDLCTRSTINYDSFEELAEGWNVYVLESKEDLADFIKGKRDFPLFKTDEEDEEKKLISFSDVRKCLFSYFDKHCHFNYNGCCKCPESKDCRECFMEYIEREIA